MTRFIRQCFIRLWPVGRTRILWGWRFHSLGSRSALGRPLEVTNPKAISLGSRVTIGHHFVLSDLCPGQGEYPKITIGDRCTIMYRFQCNAAESVEIGKSVLIGSNVTITDSDHVVDSGIPTARNPKLVTRPVRIEDNCWIAQNAVILKGVTVGYGSIIGANSVVTRDVPPRSVVVGNPARVIKRLDNEPEISFAEKRTI